MSSQISLSNAVDLYQFASAHSCDVMLTNSRDYIVNHFLQLKAAGNFDLLDHHAIEDIIKDDDLNVSKEETVYQLVMSWVEHDLESRLPHLIGLLACVRFPLMDNNFLMLDVMGNELIL